MKKGNKIFVILLLFCCVCLTGCGSKLSEQDIKSMLEVNTVERTFTVNDVIYATNKYTVNGVDLEVNGNMIALGDFSFESNSENHIQIIGYYDQSSAEYNIYRLSEDNNGETTVWSMKKDDFEEFNNVGWENKVISNATDLILIDCKETIDPVGQTPLRYRVYALVDNELVLID